MYFNGNMYREGYEIIDGFVIKKIMGGEGESCFGEVYAVQSKATGDYIAVKTLQGEEFTQDDFNEFKKEALPWILFFRHPYIVEAYGLELDKNKRPILLLELVCSEDYKTYTLNDYLNDSLCENQILRWCIQLCYAMDFINDKGYIHGDLKPDNILIKNDDVKITDFGLSQPIDSNEYLELGPVEYRAPELCDDKNSGKNISTEIYAFGMLMYQMLNQGKLPTDVWYVDHWCEFHKNGEIPKFESDLFPIVEKCLEKKSEDRYNSFKELNDDLIMILKNKYSMKVDCPDFEVNDMVGNVFRGRLFARLNDVKNCKKYYYKVLKKYPHNNFILGFALDLIYLKHYDEALKFLKELEKNPIDLDMDLLYINMGNCYRKKNQFNNALIYYKKAITHTDNLNAHLNVANIYTKYGLFEDALKEYNYILRIDKKNESALYNISELYKIMGKNMEYNSYIDKLDKIYHNLETEFYLGLSVKDTNLMRFLSALSNVENHYYFKKRVLFNRFKFDLENGNLSEANNKFNEILESSEDLKIPLIFCELYAQYGFEKEAIKKLDFIYPSANQNYKNKIICQKSSIIENFDVSEAIRLNKLLLTKNISDKFKSNVYSNLGDIYFIEEKEYVNCYVTSLEFNPKNMHSYKKLVAYYIVNEKFGSAKEYLDKGLSFDSEDFDLLYLKGIYNYFQENYSVASDVFKECLELKPTENLYQFLASCNIKLDNKFDAGRYLMLASNISLL